MRYVEVATQADLDALLLRNEPGVTVRLIGSEWFYVKGSSHIEARGSSHVEAWESSHVEARGSSHVVAWGSSHVVACGSSHVEARGSSHVEARESSHVEACGSSHIEARGSSHVEAWGSSHVVASAQVAVHKHDPQAVVIGGVVIEVRHPMTTTEWADFYGVTVADGVATLYKGVRADLRSKRGFLYATGATAEAHDWDGGESECGGGLHFSPHPAMTLEFDSEVTRWLACPVALEDMRAPREGDMYPSKIKARRTCGPVYEVDRTGQPLRASSATPSTAK